MEDVKVAQEQIWSFSLRTGTFGHTLSLSMVSPVLRNVIQDCSQSNILLLGGDGKRGWLLMLNFLHPLKSVYCDNYVKPENVADMVRFLSFQLLFCDENRVLAYLSHKYAVEHFRKYLDEILIEYMRKGCWKNESPMRGPLRILGAVARWILKELFSAIEPGVKIASEQRYSSAQSSSSTKYSDLPYPLTNRRAKTTICIKTICKKASRTLLTTTTYSRSEYSTCEKKMLSHERTLSKTFWL